MSTALRTCIIPESLECFRMGVAAGVSLQAPNTLTPMTTLETANGDILIDSCRSDLEQIKKAW